MWQIGDRFYWSSWETLVENEPEPVVWETETQQQIAA